MADIDDAIACLESYKDGSTWAPNDAAQVVLAALSQAKADLAKVQADYDECYRVKEKAYLAAMDADASQKAAFVMVGEAKNALTKCVARAEAAELALKEARNALGIQTRNATAAELALKERERIIEKLKAEAAAGRLLHEISDAMKLAGIGGLARQNVMSRLASPQKREALHPPQSETLADRKHWARCYVNLLPPQCECGLEKPRAGEGER